MEKKKKFLNLRAEIVRNGETQKEVAKLLGISAPTFSMKLAGEIDWKYKEIEFLCEHYRKGYNILFK